MSSSDIATSGYCMNSDAIVVEVDVCERNARLNPTSSESEYK